MENTDPDEKPLTPLQEEFFAWTGEYLPTEDAKDLARQVAWQAQKSLSERRKSTFILGVVVGIVITVFLAKWLA